MVEQKLVVTCNDCGSKEVSFTEERTVVETRTVTDDSLDHHLTEASKVRLSLKCHCNKCGKDFEENLGVKAIPITPGYFEL